MRLVKVFGAALVVVFALSAMAAAGASAHNFTASVVPTLILTSAEGPQVFVTLAGTLECSTATGHGIALAKTSETQKVTVSYTGCLAAITTGASVKPTEPITAEYEFNANGTVKILKAVTIVATLGTKCTITVPAQGPLSSVSFANKGTKEILVSAKVTGIESSDVGGACKEVYTGSKTGTYNGNNVTKADGTGSITWE
jgi:hypothetical protein